MRRHVGLVASQVIGQLALVAVIPVLTRVFPPAELGVYQVAFAIAFILLPLATLRMEYIVPTTLSHDLVRRRLSRATVVTLGLSITVAAAGLVALESGAGAASRTLLMMGLLIPALGLPVLDGARLIRRGARRALAVRNLVGGVAGAALQATFALSGADVTTLPIALLAGRVIGIAASRLVKDAAGADDGASGRDQRYGPVRAATTIAAGTLSGVTLQGLTVIAGFGLGTAAAGQVGVAQRVAGTPIGLAGQALAQTTQLSFSGIIREQRPVLRASLSAHIRVFLTLGILLGVALAIGGPLLAAPVLGPEWAPAGVLIAVLGLPAALQVAVSPTDPLFVMLGRERRLLALQATRAVVTWTAGLAVAALTGDLLASVFAFALAWTLAYALSLTFVLRAARDFDREHAHNAAPVQRVVFAAMTGDYPNIGDAVIRREAMDWLDGLGRPQVFVGRAPRMWIDQIGAADADLYRGRDGFLRWIGRIAATRAPVVLFEPGEVQLELRHTLREAVFLAVSLLIRARGGTIVYAPRAIARPSGPALTVYRLSMRLATVVPLRNQRSLDLIGSGVHSPDIGFGRRGRADATARRDTLAVSLRGARAFPTDAWIAAVRSVAARHDLRLVTLAQVRSDEARAAELAHALDAEHVKWGDADDLSHERRLLRLYGHTRLVVSDRLHVLILATVEGAIPLELVANPSGKVASHFAQVGITGVSVDADAASSAALSEALETALARSAAPLRQSLLAAAERVAGVRADARAALSASRSEESAAESVLSG